MTGKQTHLAELADCERALGRPERAIDLFRGADQATLEKAGAIELLIVAAGARGDLGQHDAAVAMLQVKELTAEADADWAARLRYAYADALLAAGRREEAREWFSRAAAADDDEITDAAERLLELDGVTIEGDDQDEDEDDAADGERAVARDDEDADEVQDGERRCVHRTEHRDQRAQPAGAEAGADELGRRDEPVPVRHRPEPDEDDDDLADDLDTDVDAGIDSDEDERADARDEDEVTGPVVGPDADEDSAEPTDGELAGTDADDLAATDPAAKGKSGDKA